MLLKNLFKNLAISQICKRSVTSSSIQSVFDSNRLQRTHYCGNLGIENDGQEVRLCGWLQSVRSKNFILVRDVEGIVQVYLDDQFFSQNGNNNHLSFDELKEESVVSIIGRVRRRPIGQENSKMKTGKIEVKCDKIELLNESKASLPFTITDLNRPSEQVRLKYRYLDLRFNDMQHNLILRSNFVHSIRNFMKENKFFDIETPTLFRRTPGGAREFLVPTNRSEYFYCLTQSPQQFKQLLMVAGFDRYYQIARCYRDETSKQDRQPEFTQIDIEMSFVNENDIINLIESMLSNCWPYEKLSTPFKRMRYDDAIHFYGVDKPDLRFDMKFLNLSNHFRQLFPTGVSKIDSQLCENTYSFGFKINQEYDPSLLDLNQIEKEYKLIFKDTHFENLDQSTKDSFVFLVLDNNKNGNNISKYMNDKVKSELLSNVFNLKENEKCVIMISKHKHKLLEILGKLRLRLADVIDDKKISENSSNKRLIRDPKKFEFLWVVDFPLFTINEETLRLESTHHPFTAPISQHLNLVQDMKDLEKVTGLHYDIVLNGSEIGGGSIRIHNSQLQRHILKNILKEDIDQLEHLLSALQYGAPPHGGIALGLDRLVAIMCGTQNIRNVIAFPKAQSGRDLMSSAPSKVPQSELFYYNINCIQKE